MSIFGAYLDEAHPRHEQFIERVDFLYSDFQFQKDQIETRFPNLVGLVKVSYSNILLVVSKYLNDLMLFDTEHDLERFMPSKMLAYTIRWVLLNPPVVSIANDEEFAGLSDQEQTVLLTLSAQAIDVLIDHFLSDEVTLFDEMAEGQRKVVSDILDRLHYYAKTGSYNAKNATLFFEMLRAG